MPMEDWGGRDIKAKYGIVYVSGHSHRNYFFDDGKTRIYANNQVGYKGKRVSFKKLFMIKHSGIYMFLMQSPKGRLSVLNGGTIKNVKNHSLEYFYENLTNYA